jgi:hypothetical protein
VPTCLLFVRLPSTAHEPHPLNRAIAGRRSAVTTLRSCRTPSARARARARVEAGNQRPWPADKVERWSIDRLIPYSSISANTSPPSAALAASIKEWGWTTLALVGEDGGLIAGHARVLAARQLGIAEIPVMVAAGWTEAQKRAYACGCYSATTVCSSAAPISWPSAAATPRCAKPQ